MGLNSRQGGGGDLPSLDLAFALDKTLTSRKGPTPAFTRSSTATFVGSNGLIQSAAINVARFDHYPTTGESKGFLINESRENLKTHSENFSDASWGAQGASVSTLSGSSPSGGSTITKITEDTSTGGHGLSFFMSPSGSLTLSVFAKADGRQWLRLQFGGVDTWFDLVNGVPGTIGAGHVAAITNYDNGWWRCSVSSTIASAGTTPLIRLASNNNISAYTGDGTSGLYLWGAQLEAGAFPTSYIPTNVGTAARSADVCSIEGDAFSSFYNQSEGTWVVDFILESSTSALQYLIDKNSFGVPIVYKSNGTIKAGLNQVFEISNPTPLALNTLYRVAFAYKAGDYGLSVNGSAVTTSNNAGNPALPTEIIFGSRGNLAINSPIARITYYRKRLPNAKLQTLTAP